MYSSTIYSANYRLECMRVALEVIFTIEAEKQVKPSTNMISFPALYYAYHFLMSQFG